MHIGTHLKQIAERERSACPNTMRQAIVNARAPIERWRASEIGQALEQQLGHALSLQEEEKRRQFSDVLSDHIAWLPSYLATLFQFAGNSPSWQPPLTDVATSRQTGLYLIERVDMKLSLILLHSAKVGQMDAPQSAQLSQGHVMLCPVSGGPSLPLKVWRKTGGGPNATLTPAAGAFVHPAQPFFCTLSQAYVHPMPDEPTLLLRLEWPEAAASAEQFFDLATGASLPQRIGSIGFRRHLALTTIAALSPAIAAQHLPTAIAETTDGGLAWHYTRQLLATAPELALPILETQRHSEHAHLRTLAAQTLAILRDRYAPLFEAA